MIYLAIFLFLLPIALRLTWYKKDFLGVLIPTIATYSLWYVVSFFCISIGVSNNHYLWVFLVFPFGLLAYETYVFQGVILKKKAKINLNYLWGGLGVLSVLAVCNLLTYKYIWDSNIYEQFGIAFRQNGHYATTSFYRFNSFYYLATVFGLYNTQFFYTVFLPYTFGVILVLLLFDFIRRKYPEIYKWYFLLLFVILTGLFTNTIDAIEGNWTSGLIVVFAFANIILLKTDARKSIAFDLLLMFLLNISVTAIVVGLFLSFVIKVKLMWTNKEVYPFFSLIPLLFLMIVFVFRATSGAVNLTAIIFFFVSYFLSGVFYLVFRNWKINFLVDKVDKYLNFKMWINWAKKRKFLLLNASYVLFVTPLVILTIFYKINVAQVPQTKFFLFNFHGQFNFLNFANLHYHDSIEIFTISIIVNAICLLLFLNFWFYMEMEYLIVVFLFLGIEDVFYFLLLFVNVPFFTYKLPNYLTGRAIYGAVVFSTIMLFLGVAIFTKENWRKIPVFLLPIATCFTAVFPYGKFYPVFSFSIIKNNQQMNKADFALLLKEEKRFKQVNVEKIYSEVELTIQVNYPTQLLYYDRKIITSNAQRRMSIFNFLSWNVKAQKRRFYIKQVIARNNYNLGNNTFFTFLVLQNHSSAVNIPNVKKNYEEIAHNDNIGIYTLKKNIGKAKWTKLSV